MPVRRPPEAPLDTPKPQPPALVVCNPMGWPIDFSAMGPKEALMGCFATSLRSIQERPREEEVGDEGETGEPESEVM